MVGYFGLPPDKLLQELEAEDVWLTTNMVIIRDKRGRDLSKFNHSSDPYRADHSTIEW